MRGHKVRRGYSELLGLWIAGLAGLAAINGAGLDWWWRVLLGLPGAAVVLFFMVMLPLGRWMDQHPRQARPRQHEEGPPTLSDQPNVPADEQ